MKQETAEALHEMIKLAAKSFGYEGEIIATVCNAKIPTVNYNGRKRNLIRRKKHNNDK